jgi:hypothetical protein
VREVLVVVTIVGLKVVRIGKGSVMGEERCECGFEE